MTSDGQGPASKAMIWIGWLLSALPSLMLLFSGGMKLVKPQMFEHMGFPEHLVFALGIVEVGCTLVYTLVYLIRARGPGLDPAHGLSGSSCNWNCGRR